MREIKFRAWDKERKIMEWVCNIDFYLEQLSLLSPRPPAGFKVGDDLDLGFHHVELMQYTGLKDKNGKEIYEGDIVECVEMHDSNIDYCKTKPPRYEIIWYKDDACFIFPRCSALPCDLAKYWEVIGNIYENSELLGEK